MSDATLVSRESHLRESVQRGLQEGGRDHAMQYARLLLAEFPGTRSHRFLRNLTQGEACLRAGFRPYRVSLLSSFSIEFMHDALIAQGLANGLLIQIWQGGFATFRQQILDPGSELYASVPDLVILAVEGEDWVPELYGRYSPADPNGSAREAAFAKELGNLLGQFRSRSNAPILVHDLAPPSLRPLGIADAAQSSGQTQGVARLNQVLAGACATVSDALVVGYAGLVAQRGVEHWYDPRMRLYARLPLSQDALGLLAREYLKYARALLGLTRKCLVLDLDNTLWGGVVGEDGVDGIQLGANYPGSAFVEFQRAVLALRARGILLAIASKNNAQDVEEVFTRHPAMVVGLKDFSAVEVHWEPKSESLRRTAAQLNIGLDHLVFVDDNPAECDHVRALLPMVTVIQLPPRPESYVRALLDDGWFDSLTLSREDVERARLYDQRDRVEALREASTDLLGFYHELDMTVTFAAVSAKTLPRAAQLTQKTNQFNATTRRYAEGQVAQRMADPDWWLTVVSLSDRFGDNGIIGVIMAHRDAQVLDVDTLLLSCRVIGRGVETAMLAYLCERARDQGLRVLRGCIVRTPKNAPVRDLYKRHGFFAEAGAERDTRGWRLNLTESAVAYPAWFKLIKD